MSMDHPLKIATFLILLVPMLFGATDDSAIEHQFLLAKHRAGYVEEGMTINALLAKYGRGSIKIIDRNLEGTFSPWIEITLDRGASSLPSLLVEISWEKEWVVNRTIIYDKRFKTDKGIGVGSTLEDVRRLYKLDWISYGEGSLFARVSDIGMSFELDVMALPRSWYKTRDMKLVPDSAKVTSILVVG